MRHVALSLRRAAAMRWRVPMRWCVPTRWRVLLCALLLALGGLAGCKGGDEGFMLTDITGAPFGRDFQLTDHNGTPRRLADFRGKLVVLFFGYTHCPDVCPTTLAELAGAMQQLGADAGRVQVLFVTVDPERDTPALLAQYVPAFNPSFLGLYGDADATARTAKEFKIFYRKQPGRTPDGYTMDHSAGSYVFDREGRLRLLMPYGQKVEALVHDLRLLLAAPG
ncbi:MAG TPA: SCO family protein [Burkholderiales bacterium]|nr:SCO family protein [Burkholderiales bacterium]